MGTWLVTGGSGFLGRHVLAALHAPGSPATRIRVLGRRQPPWLPDGEFLKGDLQASEDLVRALAEEPPEVVIHAAGQTPPADAERFHQINAEGTIRLLSALGSLGRPVRVVVVGSAAELGPVPPQCLPVSEEYPAQPQGAYALSKWEATRAALRSERPLEVVVARVFNPIGPGMPESQAFGRFARLLAAPGPDPLRLSVGDLDAKRDFIDVRDVAEALLALALRGQPGRIYHVGTGHSRSVGEGLRELIALSRRPVIVEPSASDPRGPTDSRADLRRMTRQTGWHPRIPFERSLADLWAGIAAEAAASSRSVA